MSFQKTKSDIYCVDERHRSAATKVYGNVTSKRSKVLNGYCSICDRKTFMTFSGNTIKAEGSCSFFKNLGRRSAKAGKNLALSVLKNPGGALEISSNTATAAATKSPIDALSSLPEVINFYYTGKGLSLGKFV